MKYFRVEEEYLTGVTKRNEVAVDGEPISEPYDVDSEDMPHGFTIGFHVLEEDEQGFLQDAEFYPVHTDMRTFESNASDVLEQIKADYPAGEWQNNNW